MSWRRGSLAWDFDRPEATSIATFDFEPSSDFYGWLPTGESYRVLVDLEGRTQHGPTTLALEERRAADGSLVRAVNLGAIVRDNDYPNVELSPDSNAVLLHPSNGAPPRIIVFG